MKRKILISTGLLIVLSYFIFAVFTFSYKSDKQVCKGIEVTVKDSSQLRFISKKEIAHLLEKHHLNPVGLSMNLIKTEEMEKMLKQQFRIKNAECYKTPSGKVRVEITQREPILRIMSNARSYYIDKDGETMPLSSSFTAYVPVVTGAVNEKLAKGILYDFALYLKKNPFWDSQIEQIHMDYNEEVELVPRVGNHIIILGKLDNYEYKLNKLYSLYEKGFSKTGWNRYKKINLKYDNQVVCTKE
jgi:cell division protein FtsQ